ncbi:MAG: FtsX-like permease family protein [Actinomycetia bacterium]|nr:FtsX-like permease family protein [Actinomycetes bacterium]
MALIAIPVAAIVGGATGVRMAVASDADELRGRFGQADLVVHPATENGSITPAALSEALWPDGRYAVSHSRSVHTVERFDSIFLTDADVTDPIFQGHFSIIDGSAPTGPAEIAPDRWMVDRYDLDLGDTIRFEELGNEFTVVGVAVRNEATHDQMAVVAPGTLAERTTYHIDLGSRTTEAFTQALSQRGYDATASSELTAASDADIEIVDRNAPRRGSAKRDALAASVFAAGIVVLGLAALVVSAAFAISIRRRQRELGLLATIGAEPDHLRRAVQLEGAVVGLVASVAGTTIGLISIVVARPWLEEPAGRLFGPLQPTPAIVVGGIALGVSSATLAAWLPARGVTRQPAIEALAARRPPQPLRSRTGIAGIAIAALSLLAVLAGSASASQPLLVAGGLGAFVGVLLSAPVVIERLATVAGRLPPSARIGIRDLARNRTRSAALFAAVLAALAIPIATMAAMGSESAHSRDRYTPAMGDNHILLANNEDEVQSSPQAETIDETAGEFLDILDGVVAAGSYRRVPITDLPVELEAQSGTWEQRHKYPGADRAHEPFWGPLVIADDGLLDALAISEHRDDLEAGTLLGIGPGTGESATAEIREGSAVVASVRVVATDAEHGWELPTHLMSSSLAASLGYSGTTAEWIFRLDHPPTDDEIEALRSIAARKGLYVTTEAGRFQPPVIYKAAVFAATAGLALLIVSIVTGLAAAENRRDRTLLVAIGASPTVARTAAATGVATIVFLAGVTAAALGVGLVGTHQLGRSPEWPGGPTYSAFIPWASVAFVVLAVPALSYAVAWSLNRPPGLAELPRPT